jgi:hypothetical protein
MTALKWWLRIVGSLYLLEGVGLTAQALFVPDAFAAVWTSTPVGVLDAVSVRGLVVAGLPGVLTWVLLGVLMWLYSRTPAKAGLLVVVVAAWELLVWAPTDIVGWLNGFEVPRVAALLTIHALIGITGIVVLRRAASAIAAG